eukprot:5905860-Prymnesium_polylepis.1
MMRMGASGRRLHVSLALPETLRDGRAVQWRSESGDSAIGRQVINPPPHRHPHPNPSPELVNPNPNSSPELVTRTRHPNPSPEPEL